MANTRNTETGSKKVRRLDVATYGQLIWWKFKKHRLAMLGVIVLAIFLILSLFTEFIAPYRPHTRNAKYLQGPPVGIHFFDKQWNFHLRPFIYGRVNKRDPVTLRLKATVDPSKQMPLRFFVRGELYKFWGPQAPASNCAPCAQHYSMNSIKCMSPRRAPAVFPSFGC